jgi:transcriptional regulator with XRE-family HTH domain
MQIIHDRILTRREELNLTQSQVAKYTGISRRAISHYETRTIPPADRLKRIADCLRVSMDYFFKPSRTDNF